MYVKFLVLLCWPKCCFCLDELNRNFSLIFKWRVVDFQWPTKESRNEFLNESKYVPPNCLIRDFKIRDRSVYVSLPRWKTGIPATLAKFDWVPSVLPTSPLLDAYPSWPMQTLEDCFSLQSVHTIDIDSEGMLWALDSGVVEEFVLNRTVCPPKLVVFDLKSNFIVRHVIIPSAVRWNSSVLTTMALEKGKKIVYIADSNFHSSGLIMYDDISGKFKRFSCDQLNPDDTSANVDNIPSFIIPQFVSFSLNTDRDKLYFSTLDSNDLVNINVSVLLTDKNDISPVVADLGSKGRSSILISDSKGYMYFNVVNQRAVAQWRESSWVYHYVPRIVFKSRRLRSWISSLDVDEDGYLWIMSSRFRDYSNNKFKMEKDNMRIFRTFVQRQEKPRKPKTGFNVQYIVLILFIGIIGLIIAEILVFNSD